MAGAIVAGNARYFELHTGKRSIRGKQAVNGRLRAVSRAGLPGTARIGASGVATVDPLSVVSAAAGVSGGVGEGHEVTSYHSPSS